MRSAVVRSGVLRLASFVAVLLFALLFVVSGIAPAHADVDYNADGHSDLLWRNDATAQHYAWYMNNATLLSTATMTRPTPAGASQAFSTSATPFTTTTSGSIPQPAKSTTR